MAQFVVTVEDQALLAELRAAIARGADPRPALEAVADDFAGMERRLFESQGASGGVFWRPLSQEWAARKAERGLPAGILRGSTGRLQRSLVAAKGHPRGSKRVITRRGVTMGSTHPLAHLHQQGTGVRYVRTWRGKPLAKPRSAGSLPARPVVTVTAADRRRWHGLMSDYLLGGAGRGLGL